MAKATSTHDIIEYNYRGGYINTADKVAVPDGAMIAPSTNVIYNRNGKPISLKNVSSVIASAGSGGSRAFALDASLVGLMGKNTTTKKATGNMLQAIGRSLWFVGNSIGDSDAVRVLSNFSSVTNIGALSSIPQLAKYNGSGWNSPVQVGLAPVTSVPELKLTTSATRDASFSGLITGSVSGRIATKRNGTVAIASGATNVITGDGDSFYLYMPDYPEDGSAQADRSWLLYFTFTGFGSQYVHLLFPIEIPESKIDGTDAAGWTSVQGNARVKVISQHASTQANRILEIEFNNNDLLEIRPFDDHYPAEACKFIQQLGNVMCLIGTGTDGTGFDVSFPNYRESFTPDWRDWFTEVPISLAPNTEYGIFWVLGSNTAYQARWTGATQQSAPVVLTQASAKYGAIGEAASVSVNGILYFLSKGKTPVRISPDRQVDDLFGQRVSEAFSSFDNTTQLAWDEANNSIVFFCGTSAIAYQIDTNKWGSLCSITTNGGGNVSAAFSMNRNLYLCDYNSGASTYETGQWNAGAALTWRAVSTFKGGKSGLFLKDIIELRCIGESETQPYTITLKAHKNFVTSSPNTLLAITGSSTGEFITARHTIETANDFDLIAVEATGTLGGQAVHDVFIEVEVHTIERP